MAKVLVVEDDPSYRSIIELKLQKEGFSVDTASDGEEGLQKALSTHPDIVLLDVFMPKIDGASVLKALREDQWGKTAHVIVLTNINPENPITQTIQSYHPSSYLMKANLDMDELVKKMHDMLLRTSQ